VLTRFALKETTRIVPVTNIPIIEYVEYFAAKVALLLLKYFKTDAERIKGRHATEKII
jgi:hypothetical protein